MNATECRTDREPLPGDTWQGDALNKIVPPLEAIGFMVIPGTLDHTGLSVRGPSGCRTRIDLISPGEVRVHAEDEIDEAPSDQFPQFGARPMRAMRGVSIYGER